MSIHNILGKYLIKDGIHHVFDFEKSKGSYFYDKNSEKYYLDLCGMFASQPIGYNHPKLISAYPRLMDVVGCKITNSDFYSEPYAKFVETFFANLPTYFKSAFFIEGGALAVENALKVAFDWKARKLGIADAFANNLSILHLKHAFHGRSGYTMSLTNTTSDKTDLFPKFNWPRIHSPEYETPPPDVLVADDDEKFSGEELCSLSQAADHLRKGNVAAVIMEPIQGEGGDRHFTKQYIQELRKLALDHEALFIVDEIQTGMGLTGRMWCHEHFDIEPDIMCFGKKTQVCGIAVTDRIDDVQENVFIKPSRINSTWGGNIVDMVRATIFLEIINEEKLVENAARIGKVFKEKLFDLGVKTDLISNVRGRGLMIAFDLRNGKARDEFKSRLGETTIVLGCGDKSIRLRPSLSFNEDDVNVAVDNISKALK